MRIALIAPPWLPVPPPAYGGTEVVADTLAQGLQEAGHTVVLATTGDGACPVRRTWAHERSRPEDLGNVLVELRHLVHTYEATAGVDIIHDHTVAGPLLASRAGRTAVDRSPTTPKPSTGRRRARYR